MVALGDCRVEFETAVVVGEIERAAGRKAPHAALYEGDVVALYVEYALFFFGVGEGRRVAEDEVVLAVAFGKPRHDVRFDEAVAAVQFVGVVVAVRPVEVGL